MQPKRQGRPPTLENARERILDDAANLFAREGYDGTSLGDLAVSVGVTKAAIYHYFPNKKEIYEGIIVRTLDGLLREVSAATAEAKAPEDALRRFMTAHADYFEEHYNGFLAMLVGYGGMQNVVMLAEAQQLRDDYENLLRTILSDGTEAGQFRDVDVQLTSRAVLSMLNWMARWFKPGKGRRASSFAQDYCDLILGGLRA
ncbi:TetR family transcriptional regulator [Bosea thiooxidans]|uniref:TetR family transcriptional regulator n=1 Tax=Bosea thiooxidans TaxID=53254 RepID=A0A0Q3T2Q0_9HYPH|nr:TetR/AcrR family transcriptional regulator [Bosea thiooxidans]KQK31954.1 TetR family transcriptional regulator [Bosea thiooxidans]SKB52069.1 transcriptional regulator, TetR family [Bosea thiooxidans]